MNNDENGTQYEEQLQALVPELSTIKETEAPRLDTVVVEYAAAIARASGDKEAIANARNAALEKLPEEYRTLIGSLIAFSPEATEATRLQGEVARLSDRIEDLRQTNEELRGTTREVIGAAALVRAREREDRT